MGDRVGFTVGRVGVREGNIVGVVGAIDMVGLLVGEEGCMDEGVIDGFVDGLKLGFTVGRRDGFLVDRVG